MSLNLTEHSLNKPIFYDIICEESIIGAFINEFKGCNIHFDKVDGEAFYDADHKVLWQIIYDLYKRNKNVDIVTVGKEIPPSKGNLLMKMFSCTKRSGTSYGLEDRIIVLKELYRRRTLKLLLSKGQEQLVSTNIPSVDIALDIGTSLLKIDLDTDVGDSNAMVVAEQIANEVTTETYKLPPGNVPTYISEMDNIIHCFMPGDLIILAGRPGMGKTALALSIARNMHKRGHKPFIQSIEMPTRQLVSRLISMETSIPVDKILKGRLSDDDRASIRKYWPSVPNIIINDSPRMTDGTMRNKILRLKSQQGIGIAFIDYLQLMKSSLKTDNREREISEISGNMKATAKEAGIPIVLLAQLSREVEKRPNKIPQLSDLRESGSIEQDADMVVFTYRPEYYKIYEDEKGNDLRGVGKIFFAKNRNGSLGDAVIAFKSQTAHWQSRETEITNPF